MNFLYDKIRNQSEANKSQINLDDETFKSAIDMLYQHSDLLQSQKGKAKRSDDFEKIIKPLLALEQASKAGKSPWRVVIDMPTQKDQYIDNPTIQFCSGAPSYDRLILTFHEKGVDVKIDKSCIEKTPDLKQIHAQHSPDGKKTHLDSVKTFYDNAGVQRIAILGSARVFPAANQWGKDYATRVENQLNGFLDSMAQQNALYTTVNGGWAGIQEQSMGVPMISHLMGVVHENETGNVFAPITVMPKVGTFDRVRTRAESYQSPAAKDDKPAICTYFEVDGVWGDDSKYLTGLSTALLVFEPYGFWTNIEIANGIAQEKPVAVIADPDKLALGGEYYDLFKHGEKYAEKDIVLPNGSKGSYRLYKNAKDAATWFCDCHAELQWLQDFKKLASMPKPTVYAPQYQRSQEALLKNTYLPANKATSTISPATIASRAV